jgi:hypothetical protein
MDRRTQHETVTYGHVPQDVLRWRQSLLREAGFDPGLAGRIASDPQYDLHGLLNLVDCGCPPDLAVRILAPL